LPQLGSIIAGNIPRHKTHRHSIVKAPGFVK